MPAYTTFGAAHPVELVERRLPPRNAFEISIAAVAAEVEEGPRLSPSFDRSDGLAVLGDNERGEDPGRSRPFLFAVVSITASIGGRKHVCLRRAHGSASRAQPYAQFAS